jgi:hypothetical protein
VTSPPAPWVLGGESIVCLARGGGLVGPVPSGVRRLPGPCLVVAARYTGSPVGPYLELAVGEPARLGTRVGWCFTTMVVDSADSRVGGRLSWGFPKELGTLVWSSSGSERSMRWVERDVEVVGVARRFRVPAMVPVRALQRRADGPVVVPGRLRGLARLAQVTVSAPPSDPFSSLAGRHSAGVVVDSLRFVVRPARHPFGLTSSLRAPLQVPPEPALSSPLPVVGTGAYSSVG